jgi:NitT/TauT family transport system ATP-binding protein
VFGQVQAAQMLAPLALAVTLGLSQHPAAIAAPFKLNVNGNTLVMSPNFSAALDQNMAVRVADPVATAHDFAAAIGLHSRKPVIGIVHRFSSHALMLRYWLGFAGIDPDRDVTLRVLSPSLMVEAMRSGEIDGFIAGEPWGSVAISEGLAELVTLGSRIWQRGVEKVLAFREDWLTVNADTVDRLILALSQAAAWCDDSANHVVLADLLARDEYLGQPAELILRAITGQLVPRRGEAALSMPDAMIFHRGAAGFPWRSQALWIYSQFVRWGLTEANPQAERQAADVFRSDVYRRALAGTGEPMPGASMKVEGSIGVSLPVGSSKGALTLGPDRFFDGAVFDPADINGYLAPFAKKPIAG